MDSSSEKNENDSEQSVKDSQEKKEINPTLMYLCILKK